jgi:hypothetical protein
MDPSSPLTAITKFQIPMSQRRNSHHQPVRPSAASRFPRDRIEEALGIRTYDHVTTSYQTGPYTVRHIHGPFTHFKTVGSVIILEHPEVCLTLSPTNDPKQRVHSYINNIPQVGDRWFTALNDELFVSREPGPSPQFPPQTLLEIIDPPGTVCKLPIPPPYPLNPNVDYDAGPQRTWHCEACTIDFNAIPTNPYWCRHSCKPPIVAKSVYYVRSPPPDDRRTYLSYYVMELNSTPYAPLN